MFSDLIAPILSEQIDMYRSFGFYTIKHTDGNINPIMEQILQCGSDAIHSIDPQGNMNLGDVRKKYGNRVATIGNVNCGLLQTGTEEEVIRDIKRTIDEGMVNEGMGFVFSTSNCIYTGMSLERYAFMLKTFREYCKIYSI